MERPTVSDLSESLFGSLGWLALRDEGAWVLLTFCAAWVEVLLDPVYELARERDGEPAWSRLYDPQQCPAALLPFLAYHVGVPVTADMSETQLREEIEAPTGWRRGQPDVIRTAVRRTLTGENPLVIIHPRSPSVGHHYVRTLLSQTPSPTATAAVARAAIPAWEVVDYAAIEGVTVADVAASTKWTTVADLAAAFESVNDLAEVIPSEL